MKLGNFIDVFLEHINKITFLHQVGISLYYIKCVFDILYNICLKYSSFKVELCQIRWKMCIGLHLK